MNTVTTINNEITTQPTQQQNPSNVSVLQRYYDKVFSDGKLVHVHIGMWGMSHNLTENDIKLKDKLPKLIKLGKKFLIKEEVYKRFKNCEAQIRNCLYANSFNFPLVSQAHFVPKSKFMEVYSELNKLKDKFMSMSEEFFEKYEEYKREAIDYYKEHSEQLNVDIETLYPSLGELKKKFYVDIASFEISLPTNFKEVDLHTEVAREVAADQAKSEALRKYNEEYSKQVDLHMNKINDFVQNVVSTLRTNVMAYCSSTLSKIQKGEIVSDSSVRRLLGHIKEFKSMNFMDDQAIDRELSKVESLLTKDTDFTKDKDALHILQERLTTVVNEAKNVNDFANVSGEYFRKINF